jgi:tRNA threonylcarbamoyl adenosine modification protein YeaZ
MKILALEFSSPQRSVAVLRTDSWRDELHETGSRVISKEAGRRVVRSREVKVSEVMETGPGATRALLMIERVLRHAALECEQVERLAIGLGPGSYTGIRAAIALAQGWQLARTVTVQGLSSAECVARQAQAEGLTGRACVVIDAQRGEFYLAGYELGPELCRETHPLRLATRAEVQQREQEGETLVGPEVTRWFPAGRIVFPSAALLARMAAEKDEFVSGERVEPIYLRKAEFVKAPPRRSIP